MLILNKETIQDVQSKNNDLHVIIYTLSDFHFHQILVFYVVINI